MSKESHRKAQPASRESAKRATEPLVLVKENRLAHAAVSRLAQPQSDDPVGLVYLYGPSGVGKSHFVRHLVREAHKQSPRLRLLAATTSEFVAKLSEAFAGERRPSSRNSIRPSISSCSRTFPPSRGALAPPADVSRDSRLAEAIGGPRAGDLHVAAGTAQEHHFPPGQPFTGRKCVPMELLDEASRLNFAQHFAACRQIPLSSQAAEVLARKGPATPREILAALVNLDLDAHHNGAIRTPGSSKRNSTRPKRRQTARSRRSPRRSPASMACR